MLSLINVITVPQTWATFTTTPLRINLLCSLIAVSAESPWSLRRVAEHDESIANAFELNTTNAAPKKYMYSFS